MPKRPSKSKAAKPAAKNAGAAGGNLPGDRKAQEQHRNFATKSILGKFQGRKSI